MIVIGTPENEGGADRNQSGTRVMVPPVGIEPTLPCENGILNLATYSISRSFLRFFFLCAFECAFEI